MAFGPRGGVVLGRAGVLNGGGRLGGASSRVPPVSVAREVGESRGAGFQGGLWANFENGSPSRRAGGEASEGPGEIAAVPAEAGVARLAFLDQTSGCGVRIAPGGRIGGAYAQTYMHVNHFKEGSSVYIC